MITFVLICENCVRHHLGFRRRMNLHRLGCCYRRRYSHLHCCGKNCYRRSYRMNETERKSCWESKNSILANYSMNCLCVQNCLTNRLNESVD